jgi:sulfide:quinone oxidoreductase
MSTRVLIAGGGVGALESALALRALAGERVSIELVSPSRTLVYRPLTVAEPFGYSPARELPLTRLERTHRVAHVHDVVDEVDVERRCAHLHRHGWRDYDELIVAVGARPRTWLPGALTFRGEPDVTAYQRLLDRVGAGELKSLLFAAPPGVSWTLPLYELALLTAAWIARRRIAGVDLSVATHEPDPLAVFGPAAAGAVRDLLIERGVRISTGADVDVAAKGAQQVVTLPLLHGDPPAGLPRDAEGFVPVDGHGAVDGAPGVWAVGDVAAHEIKQGGLATAQADAAAAAIALRVGANVRAEPFRPVLHGLLLTGVASAYLRAERFAAREGESLLAFNPLWSPPAKVAGRYAAPYLTEHAAPLRAAVLEERVPVSSGQALRDRDEIRSMALEFARADAGWGDYRSALRWLDAVELIDGALAPELAWLREQWEAARAGVASR